MRQALVLIFTLFIASQIPVAVATETTAAPAAAATIDTPASAPAPLVKIEGFVQERGTQVPLAQVNIYCFPGEEPEKAQPIKATTDMDGRFSIEVPTGDLNWVINLTGYNRFEKDDEQLAGKKVRKREFYLEKTSYLGYETTVYGATDKRDDKTKSLNQAQFLTVPGANGDPVKAVQNLPGVNRAQPFSSQVIIEGSAPQDTRYNIDGHPVPLIFHFGGLSSVVIPEAVDHVDYVSAGFGPEFGQTTAGMVNLTVKDPQTDRTHGFVFVDIFNAGGMMEGPTGDKSSYLVGARKSYIGFMLGKIAKKNKDFNFTVAPDYEDLVLQYKTELTPIDQFKIITVASRDKLGFVLSEPVKTDPSIRGSFDDETEFFRLIPQWTHRHGQGVVSRTSLGLGRDWFKVDAGSIYVSSISDVVTARVELEDQVNDAWKTYIGLDNNFTHTKVDFQVPYFSNSGGVSNPVSTATTRQVNSVYNSDALGLYWRNILHSSESRWTYLPGVRMSYYNQTNEFIPEPRVAARYALDHGLTLRSASGLYNEAPPVQDRDATFGNPGLKSERAAHFTIGFEKDLSVSSTPGWTVSNDLFYKYLYNLVVPSSAFSSPSKPEYYNNSGYGRSFGTELMIKYKNPTWQGWLAYTLSRSSRGDSANPERLFTYDQTHLITAVADHELGRNWKMSARARYATGNPYTPVTGGVFDADNDVYIPIRGDIYSQRMGAFFQFDLRVDKKWIHNTWIMTAYLDIQNLTNQDNPQQINYSYDYRQNTTVSGLPILPTLGVKAEF